MQPVPVSLQNQHDAPDRQQRYTALASPQFALIYQPLANAREAQSVN